MKTLVFAIFDLAVEAYGTPFFAPTHASAVRSFKDAMVDPNTMFSKHPEDYRLFVLGEYEDQGGILSAYNTPMHVISGTALKNVELQEAAQ